MSPAPPVIVMGAQRSGTTALASVLDLAFDKAGGIFTVNGKLPYVLHRWVTTADLEARHLRVDEMIWALRRKPPFGTNSERWLATTETVLRAAAVTVSAGEVTDAVRLRRDVLDGAYAGATRFGEKYNEYLLELDALAESLPDAHWVLLIRHPEAVARSTLRWTGDRPWRPPDREAALAKWVAWHEPWLAHPRTADQRLCTVVEYGRLCAGPGLARLGSRLDVDLAPYRELLAESPAPIEATLPAPVRDTWTRLLGQAGL
ncbi:sulfotransferase [Nocardia abscessus]|uniref:sulfotransferase n=1 Tax=Nocardia abscessus TaxID=120957 RepID=UPI0012FC3E0F|nr:sulfotransferase [Nocardia abscessus]MCC3329186.1 sulfotransferase [Nocardia abscessus]